MFCTLVLPWVLGFEGVKWYNWRWILCWKQFFGSMIPMENCIKWGDCKILHNLSILKKNLPIPRGLDGRRALPGSSGKSSPPLPDLVTHGYNLILSRTLLLHFEGFLESPLVASSSWKSSLPPVSERKTCPHKIILHTTCIQYVYGS